MSNPQQVQASALVDAMHRRSIDLSNTVVTTDYWNKLLKALNESSPLDTFNDLDLSGCRFVDSIEFDRLTFLGRVDFSGTHFESNATIRSCKFKNRFVRFDEAVFNADLEHVWNQYGSGASFSNVDFRGNADFRVTDFSGGRAQFNSATFHGWANFSATVFDDLGAEYSNAIFLGPYVRFNHVSFSWPIHVTAHQNVDLYATRLMAGGSISAGREIYLASAEIGGPLSIRPLDRESIRTASRLNDPDNDWGSQDARLPGQGDLGASALVSLESTTLNATVQIGDDVSLARCRFRGAIGLENLLLASRPFAYVRSAQIRGVKLGERQVLLEEAEYRVANRSRTSGQWAEIIDASDLTSSQVEELEPLKPAELTSTYRELRRALEGAGNAPGAADFYYGEMEMRRRAAGEDRRWDEQILLWLYWLVSGYGLRASRAVFSFLVLILIATATLTMGGFHPNEHASTSQTSIAETILFAFQSAISFFRAPGESGLSITERWIQLATRFTGPIILGLALLAARGRVRR